MNEKVIKALVEAGAVRQIRIIANGAHFYVEVDTGNSRKPAETISGKMKTWRSLDATAKWVRSIGIGEASLQLGRWTPNQKMMPV